MKRTLKTATLLCLMAMVMLMLMMVSCDSIFVKVEVGSGETIPQITTPEDVTTPEGTTPEVTTPEVTTPEVTTPEVTTPEVTTPEVTTPEVTTPEVTTPEVTTPEETTPEETPPEETPPEETTPEETTPEESIPEETPCTHSQIEYVPPVERTCTEDGHTGYWKCVLCGNGVTETTSVPAGHTVVDDKAVKPTCTQTGLTKGSHCSMCGEVFVKQNLISKLPHIYGNYTFDDPTAATVILTYTCQNCDDFYTKTITLVDFTITQENRHKIDSIPELPEILYPDGMPLPPPDAYIGTLNIPAIFENDDIWYRVVAIGDSAFAYVDFSEVVIPNTITAIGDGGFENTSSLRSITIPSSVTSIGKRTFINCDSLISITFAPNSQLTSIGENSFTNCSNLKSITIPDSVTSIGSSAFSGCSGLTSITVPVVTSIDDYTFSGCSNLTNVTIPFGVQSIGSYAFRDCSSLTSITVPNSVMSIGYSAFSGCSSLESIVLPFVGVSIGEYQYPIGYIFGTREYTGGVETQQRYYDSDSYIDDSGLNYYFWEKYYIPASLKSVSIMGGDILHEAFYRCNNITHITISDAVTSIGNMAFYDCDNLTSVTIGNGVTSIGGNAFAYCGNLTSIVIGDSVTSIGKNAFYLCLNLKDVYISDVESWLNVVIGIDDNPNLYAKSLHILNFNGDEITELTIPDSVTSIRWYAFGKCKSLTSITIPDSVTSIGDSALSGCSSLTSITFEGTVAQWNAIEFGGSWNSNVPATEVICSDGVVKLS